MKPLAAFKGAALLAILLLASLVDGESAQVTDQITQERAYVLRNMERTKMYASTLAGCARGETINLDDGETLTIVHCEPVHVRLSK